MAIVPLAGRGVILQRGIILDERAVLAHLDHPRFREYLVRWRSTGENFLMYSISGSGLHYTFEISQLDLLEERLSLVFLESSARKQFCDFRFFTATSIKVLLTPKANHHQAQCMEFRHTTTSKVDITLERANFALYGHVLFATIPAEIILQRDQASFLLLMDSLVANLDCLQENWMQLRINFTGWESDPRHFHEIPAIKVFMQGVMNSASWWMALVHPTEYIKWLGTMVTPVWLPSESGDGHYFFKPDSLRTICGIAVLEASHLLNSSEIEQGQTCGEMTANLRFAIEQLTSGVDLLRSDPLIVMAKRIALGSK